MTRRILSQAAAATTLIVLSRTIAAGPATMPLNLPPLLVALDGSTIDTPAAWATKRRPELLRLMTEQVYGRTPPRPAGMRFETFESSDDALGGLATRKQVAIWLTGDKTGPRMDLLIYLPKRPAGAAPVPVILGLNFWGNHAVTTDPAVRLTESFIEDRLRGFVDLSGNANNHATDASRGTDARRWPVETILRRGYGFATIFRGDIDADVKDRPELSLKRLYPDLQQGDDNFGTLAAWAWGLSRGMDYLETDPAIDAKRVAVFGWSRLGKAAVWAAATDERFALLLSAESGAGGLKLFHHTEGEDIHRLTTNFPHWFCRNFAAYVGREATMPIDQHFALALVAPRPVYASSCDAGTVFDPVGEFLGLKAVEPVYRLFGRDGLPTNTMPPAGRSVAGTLGFHHRAGKHDVTPEDWAAFLDFCDRHW